MFRVLSFRGSKRLGLQFVFSAHSFLLEVSRSCLNCLASVFAYSPKKEQNLHEGLCSCFGKCI